MSTRWSVAGLRTQSPVKATGTYDADDTREGRRDVTLTPHRTILFGEIRALFDLTIYRSDIGIDII